MVSSLSTSTHHHWTHFACSSVHPPGLAHCHPGAGSTPPWSRHPSPATVHWWCRWSQCLHCLRRLQTGLAPEDVMDVIVRRFRVNVIMHIYHTLRWVMKTSVAYKCLKGNVPEFGLHCLLKISCVFLVCLKRWNDVTVEKCLAIKKTNIPTPISLLQTIVWAMVSQR